MQNKGNSCKARNIFLDRPSRRWSKLVLHWIGRRRLSRREKRWMLMKQELQREGRCASTLTHRVAEYNIQI